MERETGVEPAGREATAWKAVDTPCITSRNLVVEDRIERSTSRLSSERSSHLSYSTKLGAPSGI